MGRGINKVMIIGNLGTDPDVRQMNNGSSVTQISVATSESWKDKQTGERQERTEWHRISLFDKLGEIAAKYLKKGSRVFVEGYLKTTKWQDKSGADRYSTDIVAKEMQMIDSKPNSDEYPDPVLVAAEDDVNIPLIGNGLLSGGQVSGIPKNSSDAYKSKVDIYNPDHADEIPF